MSSDHPELDDLQAAFKNAVESWISAIRREEALASAADHSVAELDQWEKAHFDEEDARTRAKAAKADYEAGLRAEFFGF
jgi:hypothetical protein